MNIAGRFQRVSRFEDDDFVLVGFYGNVWPHDLSPENHPAGLREQIIFAFKELY